MSYKKSGTKSLKKGLSPYGFSPLEFLKNFFRVKQNNHPANAGLAGFTLIELLVVIAIIGLLATIVMVSLNSARAKARDAKRLADAKAITTALALYYDKNGRYPSSDYGGCGGWDASGDGNGFLHTLVTAGFLAADPADPATNNSCANYRYYRYSAGDYGCSTASGAYFVFGINDIEKSGNPHPTSPGWSCPTRNWQGEFDWVVGRFEN